MARGLYIGLTRHYMYRVYGVSASEPETDYGFYETREEAEAVAEEIILEYADELDDVEVRDRFGEVVWRVR